MTDNFGRSLSLTYDSNGRVTAAVAPGGASYSYTYDVNGLLTKRTAPGGGEKTYLYNESGMSASQMPGLLTGVVDETGKRVMSNSYDSYSRATMATQALNHGKVQVVYGADQASVTTALGAVETYAFSTVNGERRITSKSVSCPGGSCTAVNGQTYAYDARGNQTEEVLPNGNKVCRSYLSGTNLLTREVAFVAATVNCSDAIATPPAVYPVQTKTIEWDTYLRKPTRIVGPATLEQFAYDTAGRLTGYSIISSAGNGTGSEGFGITTVGQAKTVAYTYNAAGQPLTVSGPRNDVASPTSFAYASNGDLQSVTTPSGRQTLFTAYDAQGNALGATLSNGAQASWSYNTRGQLTSTAMAGEGTSYTYLANGLLDTATSASGEVLTHEYDAANRLVGVHDQRGNRQALELDAFGNPSAARVKNASGAVSRELLTSYDALGRPMQLTGQHIVNPLEPLLRQ